VIIHKRFDFQEQSRLVLANSWEERSSGEKEHFISLFSTLQEHAYLNRLKEYSGETVQFTKQITKEEKALVFSVIIKDQEEIPIVYRMRRKEGKWLVYDVIIDGVSLVKNYRKQFASILEKETYAGLIREMEEKIKKITAEDEKHNTE
jgi:phospholipid transport system substrate-binding protein